MRDVAAKRLIAAASLVVLATTTALPATAISPSHPVTAHHRARTQDHAHATAAHLRSVQRRVLRVACKVAPADEYFGRLKMSILGIRNTIKDQGLKIDADPSKEPDTRGAIALTEDAVRDWQRKYPCDSWLPTTIFALEHFYAKVHTEDGVRHVHATFAWLRHAYPHARIVGDAQREDSTATVVPATATSTDGAQIQAAAPVSSPRP